MGGPLQGVWHEGRRLVSRGLNYLSEAEMMAFLSDRVHPAIYVETEKSKTQICTFVSSFSLMRNVISDQNEI